MHTEEIAWVGIEIAGGRYEIVEMLGEGGMGYVFKAFDAHLGTDVVVKTPKRSMMDTPGFTVRFAQEIQSLVDLSHPHIVKIIDVGVHDGLPFCVMQYLSGGSLDDRRSKCDRGETKPMRLDEIVQWLGNVATALDFVHGQGYVHRDIKPENILFDAHGNVFLSDFGIAKVLSATSEQQDTRRVTGDGCVLGTPEYMAPEVVMGLEYDGRADQYALGIVAYEMLVGKVPFEGATATAVMVQHSSQKPELVSKLNAGVSPAVAAVIARALEKAPDERFESCHAFISSLVSALGSDTDDGGPGGETISQPSLKEKGTIFEVRCPNPDCGKLLHLRAEHAGRKARCKACDVAVYIDDNLSVSTSPRETTTRSSAKADTVVAQAALNYESMTQHELSEIEGELRASLVRLALDDKGATLPDIQVLRDARRDSDLLRREIAELKMQIPRIEQEQREFAAIAEELAERKEAVERAKQQLDGLHGELGERAYQGLVDGNLDNQPLFTKRKACGEKLGSLKEEYDRLSEAKGLFEKTKAKAKQAVLWGQIRIEEANASTLSKSIGKDLIETESEHIVECPETEEALAKVAEAREAVKVSTDELAETTSDFESKRGAIQTALGLDGLQYPKQLQKEILRCSKLLNQKETEFKSSRDRLPNQVIATSTNLELDRATIFGRALLDLRDIERRLTELGEAKK